MRGEVKSASVGAIAQVSAWGGSEVNFTSVGAGTGQSHPLTLPRRPPLHSSLPPASPIAQDHFNDVLTNVAALVALACVFFGGAELWWADSTGAIALSVYIL